MNSAVSCPCDTFFSSISSSCAFSASNRYWVCQFIAEACSILFSALSCSKVLLVATLSNLSREHWLWSSCSCSRSPELSSWDSLSVWNLLMLGKASGLPNHSTLYLLDQPLAKVFCTLKLFEERHLEYRASLNSGVTWVLYKPSSTETEAAFMIVQTVATH